MKWFKERAPIEARAREVAERVGVEFNELVLFCLLAMIEKLAERIEALEANE